MTWQVLFEEFTKAKDRDKNGSDMKGMNFTFDQACPPPAHPPAPPLPLLHLRVHTGPDLPPHEVGFD